MKYIKPLISLCIVSVVVLAIFYLWRRTNILLSSINSMRGDLTALKHTLLTGTPPVESPVNAETNEPFVDSPPNQVGTHQKIQDTQQNITLLKSSIEQLENMISSSEEEEDDSSVSGTESDEELAVAGDVDEILNSDHLMSYGLEAPEINSELEGLLDNKIDTEIETDPKKDDVSFESNQPEANLEKTITDQVKIDVILKSYSKKQLENLCGDNYLSKSGSKTALTTRLLTDGYEFKISTGSGPETVSVH